MTSAIAGKYGVALRRHGGIRGLLRRYGALHLADAALRESWESYGMRVLHAIGRSPAKGYGWLEAILSPTADYWFRYALVLSALESEEAGGREV